MRDGTYDTHSVAEIRGENASRDGGNRGRNDVDEMVKLVNTTSSFNLHGERLRNITREIIFEGRRMMVPALSKYLNAKHDGRFIRQIKYFAAKSKPPGGGARGICFSTWLCNSRIFRSAALYISEHLMIDSISGKGRGNI